MDERIEFLREVLHQAIDSGNMDEILKASITLDSEIADVMTKCYVPNNNMCS
jgi:hypothetical protein